MKLDSKEDVLNFLTPEDQDQPSLGIDNSPVLANGLVPEEEELRDLLIAISEAGLTLRVPAGDHVKLYVSPPGNVTPELAEKIRKYRDRIISAMQFDEYRRTEMLQNTRQVLDLWREWEMESGLSPDSMEKRVS